MRKKKTIPITDDSWKGSFQAATMRTNFALALSQPMLEYLCAVADGVQWDRSIYMGFGLAKPDNWVASSISLLKHGLIVEKSPEEKKKDPGRYQRCKVTPAADHHVWNNWKLTPAGECVVALLKVTGIFIEAETATIRKLRG